MSYTAISASQTDSGSPVDQTLMDAIRTNLDDHETRISSLFAFGNTGIIDDFMGKDTTAPDTASWSVTSGGGASSVTDAATHSLLCTSGAGAGKFTTVRGTDWRIGIHPQVYEVTSVLQVRVKAPTYSGLGGFFFGWQDRTLADTATRATDVTDVIGFIKGTGTTWKFRTAATATGATEVDSIGDPAAWGVLRLTVTCSATAGNRVIRVQSGTTEASLADVTGSPFTNPNIPNGYLSPNMAFDGNTGSNVMYFDYVLAYTTTRPLAA